MESTKHGRTTLAASPKENPCLQTTERDVVSPPPWENPAKGVYTSVCGDNSDLMERIAKLYFRPGYRIADVTYGRGVFWRKIDITRILFLSVRSENSPACPT